MKVEMGKKYRLKNGEIYKLYAVNDGGVYPVHGAYHAANGDFVPISHTLDGVYDIDNIDSNQNLVEVSPCEDFKIDDKVFVWNNFNGEKFKRHFAGVSDKGNAIAFIDGQSSWTTDGRRAEWDNCMKFEG